MATLNGNSLVLTEDEQATLNLYAVQFIGYVSLWLQERMKQVSYDTLTSLPQIDRTALIAAAKEKNASNPK